MSHLDLALVPAFPTWIRLLSDHSICKITTLTSGHNIQSAVHNATHRAGQERVADAEKAAESAVNGTPKQKAQAQQEILGTGAK
jgi:hypothetical protein